MILYKLALTAAMAFILKPSTLVQKAVENNGSGIYFIEDEVQFPTGQEPLVLKEQWIVEDDSHMKLTVTGAGIHWVFAYENGARSQITTAGKLKKNLTEEFIEKYFHFRKSERFQNALVTMGILPASAFHKPTFRLTKNLPDYNADPHERLARVGGVPTVALGFPPESAQDDKPAFFIDQDQFVIRKFRLPSRAEVSAERHTVYSHGLNFPRVRTVRWADKVVTIQTLHVQAKSDKKALTTLELSPAFGSGLEQISYANLRPTIEEFYQRFR